MGAIVEGGALKIIDRKKNIFKLSQGEYIAPEKIERVYEKCPLIQQIFVYGDSLRSNIVAIVIPDEGEVMKLAKDKSLEGNFEELCQNATVNRDDECYHIQIILDTHSLLLKLQHSKSTRTARLHQHFLSSS